MFEPGREEDENRKQASIVFPRNRGDHAKFRVSRKLIS